VTKLHVVTVINTSRANARVVGLVAVADVTTAEAVAAEVWDTLGQDSESDLVLAVCDIDLDTDIYGGKVAQKRAVQSLLTQCGEEPFSESCIMCGWTHFLKKGEKSYWCDSCWTEEQRRSTAEDTGRGGKLMKPPRYACEPKWWSHYGYAAPVKGRVPF
jgi:hypothetical protein